MSHTKEPWGVDPERELRVEDQHGRSIASCGCSDLLRDEWEYNARRIVACVNACAGLSTDLLENIAMTGGLVERFSLLNQTEHQRDELLAALKSMVEAFICLSRETRGLVDHHPEVVAARAVIARAETA